MAVFFLIYHAGGRLDGEIDGEEEERIVRPLLRAMQVSEEEEEED